MTPAEALEQVRALADDVEREYQLASQACEWDRAAIYDRLRIQFATILDAVTPDTPVTVEAVEELKALPSRAAVMDKLGDVGVLGVGGIYYPETAPVSLEYAVKHWGPFTVLTPAAPERTEQEREAAIGRAVEAFKDAWHEADEQGLEGQRTRIAMRRAIAAFVGREVSE